MRSALFLSLIVSLTVPTAAFAQEREPSDSGTRLEAMADAINDPATQAAMTSAVTSVVDALLDIRVDKAAKALAPLNGGKPLKMKGSTVRDLAARDDPDFDRRVEQGARGAVQSTGAMVQALAVMVPELQKAVKKIGNALPER